MLLDTTVLIDLIKEEAVAVEKIKRLEEKKVALVTTTVSIFETLRGLHGSNARKQTEFFALAKRLPVFVFDFDSALTASYIHSELVQKGRGIEPEDCMIAGIAKMHNETVLTRNQKRFGRISGLTIETY